MYSTGYIMTNIVSVCFLDVSARVQYSTTIIPTEKAGNVGIQRKDSTVGKKLPNGEDNKSKSGNENIICGETRKGIQQGVKAAQDSGGKQ